MEDKSEEARAKREEDFKIHNERMKKVNKAFEEKIQKQ